jgi:HSP20 family molecular chaperone IbpA
MKYLVPNRKDSLGFLDDFDRFFSNFWDMVPERAAETKIPSVDVRETKDEYILEAELPGFSESEVDVNVDNHVLHLSSKKEEDRTEEKKDYIMRERKSYSFSRSFVLPENVNEDKIKGEFKNGILTLKMPKKEEKKPKRIDIKLAS